MAISTSNIRVKLVGFADQLQEWATRHRFWFESVGVTLLALGALALFGTVALRRASDWNEQARRLSAVEERMQVAVADFEPADSAEAAAWSESEQILLGLTGVDPEPLAVAGLVARRAEEVGIFSVRLSLLTGSEAETGGISTGGWSAEPEETKILAELVDDLGATIRFVGVLPPNVEVTTVNSVPAGALLRTELHLIVRSLRISS